MLINFIVRLGDFIELINTKEMFTIYSSV